jgi:hypothetical protein
VAGIAFLLDLVGNIAGAGFVFAVSATSFPPQ